MARTQLGELVVSVRTNTAKFSQGLQQAGGKLQSFRKASQGAQRAALAFGAVGVAAITAMVKTTSAAVDSQVKFADSIGLSVKKLAGLEQAAQLNGATVGELRKGLERLGVNAVDAANGIGEAKTAFEALGINAQDFIQLAPEKQFAVVGDALQGVGNATERAALAYDIFGRSGTKLINTLKLGSAGLAEVQAEAEALGVAISRVDAAKIEQANDALLRVSQVSKGFAQQVTIAIVPAITAITTSWVESAKAAGGFGEVTQDAVTKAAQVIGVFANGLQGIEIIFVGLKLAVISFVDFTAANVIRLQTAVLNFANNTLALVGIKFEALSKSADFLSGITEQVELSRKQIEDELLTLLQEPLKSNSIMDALEDARASATALAEETAAAVAAANVRDPALVKKDPTNIPKLFDIPREDLDKLQRAKDILEAARTPVEVFHDRVAELKILFDGGFFGKGQEGLDNFTKAMEDAGSGFTDLAENGKEAIDEMSVFADQAARNMQDAFADFLFDPFDEGLEGMLASFLTTIQRMVAEAASAQIFESLGVGDFLNTGISSLFGGGLGGDVDNLIETSGLFANGGRPPVGQFAIVGEEGPELFVPDTAGTVIPNGMFGGGTQKNITINQNIAAPEPSKFHLSASRASLEARRTLNR